jgi:ADP-ribose pyrophosphatase
MNLEEKKIKSNVVFSGRVVRLEVDDVLLPNGNTSTRECIRHSGGAAVLFVKDNKIALVKQFRYVYGKEIYEIPAGKLNVGENPQLSAVRELEEEMGYRAKNVTHLCDIYPTPGYTNEIIHIYFTDSADFIGQKLDDDEFLNCTFMPLEEVLKKIDSGEICDAKTIVAVYKYIIAKNKLS